MQENKLYLRPNVVFEALVDNWYAWAHLISPATAAMNMLNRHLQIIESYLQAPAFHVMAVRNAKMRGAPFMDIPVDRIGEVKALRDDTVARQAQMIRFANAVAELDEILAQQAGGFGLERLYEKVPGPLKGFVELCYDRNNNPGFRFFESLLYESEYYNKRSQSMAFWLTDNDNRPFVFSTPRLAGGDVIHLPISFDDTAIDELARMKRTPQTMSYIQSRIQVPAHQQPLFAGFFTETAPPPYQRYTGDKIRMRYFGHACILVETKDLCILLDPVISYYGYHSDIVHFSDVDLPDVIDYVLITHNHQDHILFETLLPLRHKIRNIVVPRSCSGRLEDPDLKLLLNKIGFDHVTAVDEMETVRFRDAAITGIPFTGEHSDMNILAKSCYLVEIGGFRLMFFADSRVVEPELYRHIHRRTGDVDVIFLGMECDGAPLTWLYGPLLTKKITRDQDATRRLNGSDCARGMPLVEIFRPGEVYVYAMGQEPWLEFLTSIKYTEESNPIIQSNRLVELCRERGVIAERLYGEKELLYNKRTKNIDHAVH